MGYSSLSFAPLSPTVSLNMKTDVVSPAYVGFYHVPLSWCAEEPTEKTWQQGSLEELFKVVHEGFLHDGLHYRVRRDGFIWFDCNNWELGTSTIIPGYSVKPGSKIPREAREAEKLAEQRAHNRAMLLNAYQLCLNSAHSFVKKRATGLGVPIQSTYLVHLSDFTNPISLLYSSKTEPYCIYVNNALNSVAKRNPKVMGARRLIELDVITYSFDLLDRVLKCKIEGTLKIVELLYWAHHRYSENAFSDSLILSWTICEKLLYQLWNHYLKEKRTGNEGQPIINKERAKKLKGRDFTASIVSEILELAGVIETQLFRGIDDARRKRNAWLHSLGTIKDIDASNAMRTATELLQVATGIPVRPSISRTMAGTGGMPLNMYAFDNNES